MIRKYVPKNAKLIPKNARKVFTGEIYQVFQWPQKMYDGSTATFEMLGRPDTVKTIAIVTPEELAELNGAKKTKDDNEPKAIITRQKQPRTDWFYDFPGGRADEEDTDELAAAKRELKEETGLEFRSWKLIEAKQPFEKTDWIVYTFIASGLSSQGQQELDAGEIIELEAVTLDELKKLAESESARHLNFRGMNEIRSFDEILDLPNLHLYAKDENQN